MSDSFSNVYEDEVRANAYAGLEFPGTYYLGFRDLPDLTARHVAGKTALDFGCGAGRSTRFLRDLGFNVIGVDISDAMLSQAIERDPAGVYLRVAEADLSALGERRFDLILCAFTFDNVDRDIRVATFRQLGQLLTPHGRIVNLVSAPEIYVHEWLSFSTRDFPENQHARAGDVVRIVMLDVPDRRPVEDIYWTESDYRATYDAAGLQVLDVHRPLGNSRDPYEWVSEAAVAPWTIYVLASDAASA